MPQSQRLSTTFVFLLCLLLNLPGEHVAIADAAKTQNAQVLLKENFENTKQGMAAQALKNPLIELAKKAGPDGSNAIRVAYVGDNRGSKRVGFRTSLKTKVKQATLGFDVRFDKTFQWIRGGKLHGLGPKKPVTGGKNRQPDQWSARMMFKETGRLATYLYDQDPEKKYGVGDKTKQPVLKAGQWHHLAIQVSLNHAGKKNGWAKLFVDGKQVIESNKIEYRGNDEPQTLISTFLFSTFHGGSSSAWAPKDKNGKFATVYAYYDNFVVREGLHKK